MYRYRRLLCAIPTIHSYLPRSAIFSVGVYNLNLYGSTVLQGISPHWIAVWFINHGTDGWRMLGGVMLCITGTEALFADLGHFSIPSIRVRLGGTSAC